ncbi:PDZ domain (Also known as DHR or GLGF) [Rubripirellula amarantea]|uniref:PDZ domain (Also known as DHR or GLGF) n=1 Tax=Rubripirellula amarantea TaxID=2527999 RepID=A0A5C5WUW4_9BACT|nr:PDZ domain-containing protein [Rubripirellula amarantea]TWT54537.1 PDZ domain (Also known as DHR or GLGF) [Rubripirellula amarantea]
MSPTTKPIAIICVALFVSSLGLPSLCRAQNELAPVVSDAGWGFETKPIPQILRLHLPQLRHGLLVESVADNGAADVRGLRSGDILLQINGIPVTDAKRLVPATNAQLVMVLRRGQIHMLPPTDPQTAVASFPAYPTPMNPGTFRGNRRWGVHTSAASGPAASSSAASNASASGQGEAVSISQANDRFSVEMRLPALSNRAVILRGTREQIEDQIADANYIPELEARVRQELDSAGF